jgi:signal transduction histidine kinase
MLCVGDACKINAMTYANETFFLVAFIIFGGFFISSLPHLKDKRLLQAHYYWLISLGLMATAFALFSVASFIHPILLLLANTCFFSAYLYLGIYSYSLNHSVGRVWIYIPPISILIFALTLNFIRVTGSFYGRVYFVVGLTALCLVWVIYELFCSQKKIKSLQLNFLIVTAIVELILALVRIKLALDGGMPDSVTLYHEPLLSSIVRWVWIGFTVLTYMAIIGSWTETLSSENRDNQEDNLRISKLLSERNSMISNLLKANKSSSTQALSASIAHELNQPLSASLLNIQFLKTLYESDQLTPELIGQTVNQLEIDAKRSGEIIKSLRSIFAKEIGGVEMIQVTEVVENALAIYKSELISKHILVNTKLNCDLPILFHRGQLLQVLLNIINNAIQVLTSSSHDKKMISLHSYQDGMQCYVEISDTGPGVPIDRQPYLFELLSSDKDSGMGIGLWLCAHILSNFGGKIAYQEIKGGGAKFILNFPIVTTIEKV